MGLFRQSSRVCVGPLWAHITNGESLPESATRFPLSRRLGKPLAPLVGPCGLNSLSALPRPDIGSMSYSTWCGSAAGQSEDTDHADRQDRRLTKP
jgi:hypothetical protein